MLVLRSVLFTAILFVSVPPWSLAVVGSRLFGKRAAYRVARAWMACMVWLCEKLCGLSYAVEGLDNLPDRNSVVLMKHSSAYETLVQALLFPRQTWVLKRELMWAPFFGWALAVLRPIAINRNGGRNAVEQVVAQGADRLEEGLWVMVFPEGTRMSPGETRRYGVSGALLASRTGCPVLPVAHNAGDFWPRRGWRKKPGTVRFAIGPAIQTDGRDPREINAQAQAWIEGRVAELREKAFPDRTADF